MRTRRPGAIRRRALLLATALASAVGLAGCSLFANGIADAESDLSHAGFGNPSIAIGTNARPTVSVTARRNPAGPKPVEQQALGVASIIWTRLPGRFDLLVVHIDGQAPTGARQFTYAQLDRRYGPRPAGLDRQSLTGESTSHAVAVGLSAAAIVLGIGLVVTGILIYIRRRRRRAVAAQPGTETPASGPRPVPVRPAQPPPRAPRPRPVPIRTAQPPAPQPASPAAPTESAAAPGAEPPAEPPAAEQPLPSGAPTPPRGQPPVPPLPPVAEGSTLVAPPPVWEPRWDPEDHPPTADC